MAGRCLALGVCLGHQEGIAEAFGGRGSAWSPKPNGHNGLREKRPLEGA